MVESVAINKPIKIVLIGETGTGKSTLGNAILGKKEFKQGSRMNSQTIKTQIANGTTFFDDQVIVIDTPGLNDSEGRDQVNILEMIEEIKKLQQVDAFILVFNGQNIRWNSATLKALKILDQSFPNFWHNVIIVLNFMKMDQDSINERIEDGRSDEEMKNDIETILNQKFKVQNVALPIVFLNCPRDITKFKRNEDELKTSEQYIFKKRLKLIFMISFKMGEYDTTNLEAQRSKKLSYNTLIDTLMLAEAKLQNQQSENGNKPPQDHRQAVKEAEISLCEFVGTSFIAGGFGAGSLGLLVDGSATKKVLAAATLGTGGALVSGLLGIVAYLVKKVVG